MNIMVRFYNDTTISRIFFINFKKQLSFKKQFRLDFIKNVSRRMTWFSAMDLLFRQGETTSIPTSTTAYLGLTEH
jgi:hypothetical protein